MTSTANMKIKCSVCGKEHEYTVVMSTNRFGSPDLDTRPPEMLRSTLPLWVQECPFCGYAAESADDETGITADFLQTEKYQGCDGIRFVSDIAPRFYKHYLISAAEGKKEEAFYALLHAAWACDDDGDRINAAECRKRAAELADELLAEDIGHKDTIRVIKADLLRRSGQFQKLFDDYFRSVNFSGSLTDNAIILELRLARKNDKESHLISEAEDLK